MKYSRKKTHTCDVSDKRKLELCSYQNRAILDDVTKTPKFPIERHDTLVRFFPTYTNELVHVFMSKIIHLEKNALWIPKYY